MVEELVEPRSGAAAPRLVSSHPPRRLTQIEGEQEQRLPLELQEFSRVLGGGIVPGSLVLIGGDPGIGKSTLLLQVALLVARSARVLYVSGEESAPQIKARADRLLRPPEDSLVSRGQESDGRGTAAAQPEELYLLTETDVERIVSHVESLRPALLVVDSIQTMQLADVGSAAGSITQVRESAARLQAMAKSSAVAVFLVGHVTKEGAIAGPRVLEHLVDTVLYLEGDAFHAYRLLRSVKNRFGPTTEVGVFEMRGAGMLEVANPSETFLAERMAEAPGSAIALTMEGTRPLLVEVQGLTSPTPFGNPRRTANGIEFNRLLLTVAVLSQRVGLPLGEQDVFVNVVGGMQVREPGIDLALAAAIASSFRDRPLPADLTLVGEVGLSGELRAVSQLEARLSEAAKLGFRRAVIPGTGRRDPSGSQKLQVLPARSLQQALKLAFD